MSFILSPHMIAPPAPPVEFMNETFETGTFSGSWSTGGTPEANYSADALSGTYSMRCNAAADYGSYDHADRENSNYRMEWKVTNLSNGPQVARGYASAANGGGQQFSVIVLSTGAVRLLDASNSTVATSATGLIVTGQKYYFWIEVVEGTGANGVARVYYSTDGVKPASPLLETAAMNNTHPIQYFNCPGVSSTDIIRDNLLGSTAPIGNI